MKKFYSFLILSFFICTTAKAQHTYACGTSGTTITINKLKLSLYSRSGCTFDYDVTITATEVGLYKIKVANLTIVSFNIIDPGIVNFQGMKSVAFPCFLISDIFGKIDIITPSGSCEIYLGDILPVKLTSFTAVEKNGIAVLHWATATEVNNEGFFIEYTQNGDDWRSMDFVAGVGTTNEPQNYEYQVTQLPEGQHYFRLKQVDFDGRFEYSVVAELFLENPVNTLKVFPNPLHRGQPLNIKGAFEHATLYNAAGQLILHFPATDNLNNFRQLDLPAGFYQLFIQRKRDVVIEKLVIQ